MTNVLPTTSKIPLVVFWSFLKGITDKIHSVLQLGDGLNLYYIEITTEYTSH